MADRQQDLSQSAARINFVPRVRFRNRQPSLVPIHEREREAVFSEIIPCCEAGVMPDGEWISADGNHLVEITNSRSIRPRSSIALDGALATGSRQVGKPVMIARYEKSLIPLTMDNRLQSRVAIRSAKGGRRGSLE